jgi:hypothetical protein
LILDSFWQIVLDGFLPFGIAGIDIGHQHQGCQLRLIHMVVRDVWILS